jgi:D-alanyl-lipoteichoic acid acyltransferase DltB (MBOAT superfamily)
MSLSSFILRYIYIPLGGSRGSFSRTQINLMLAMIISGIWHGAGFNFFIWARCTVRGWLSTICGKNACRRCKK